MKRVKINNNIALTALNRNNPEINENENIDIDPIQAKNAHNELI